jgi:integrase
MAWSIQDRPGGKAQLRVTHALLPKPFFFTFPDRSQAESVRDQLLGMLAKGVVPQELLAPAADGRRDDPLVFELISQYEVLSTPAQTDLPTLKLLRTDIAGLRASGLSYDWVERWVRTMKVKNKLAPGTIRKRVGSLARVIDWHHRRTHAHNVANPLRLLPRGYSQYTDAEAQEAGDAKIDETRDRRLLPDEEVRIRLALAGVKRVDRERPLMVDSDLTMLFDLILGTGMRLREAYKLTIDRIDLEKGIIRLEGSKATRGQSKPRTVPLIKDLRGKLRAHCKGRQGLVFPSLWDGKPETLKQTTTRLSARFLTLFRYAEVRDFSEHDLRHEATCRWFEMRDKRGHWIFSEIEICRIMGWTSTKMALRYASLRGEDLADRLLQ